MTSGEAADAAPPGPVPRDRLSSAAFVVGLIAAITGVVYFVSVPTGLVGLVLGIIAIRRPSNVRRMALGGIMLSLIGLLVGLGLVAFLLLEGDDDPGEHTVVDGIESGTGDDAHPPQRDLDGPLDCRVDADALRAVGAVTNHTEDAVDYRIIVMWEDDGRTVAESTAILDGLSPGGSKSWEIAAVGSDKPGAVTCRVLRIDRTDAD
jgi:hypothetical protein